MLCKNLLEDKKKLNKKTLLHVAIIMDGNGRWAEKQGKMRIFGHKKGFETVKKVVQFSVNKKLKILTLYAFSRENWNRPLIEITELMELFLFSLNSQIDNLIKFNIKLKVIGDIKYFSKKLQKYIFQAEHLTLNNTGLILNIAANYGGRWDIIQSIKKIIKQVQSGILNIDHIKEDTVAQFLSTERLPPVDLLIRTGGEKRISNFLLWQIAYSELYFTDVLWPDFNEYCFQKSIDSFMSRDRRFGGFKKK